MSWLQRFARIFALALLVAGSASCLSSQIGEPRLVGEGRKILFVGNSLTYFNDLPYIVQALADSAGGERLAVEMVAFPDYALIDHWREGTARREIAREKWELVVLQQGPSSVDINRDSLRLLTGWFDAEIKKAGGRSALYSVWPTSSRQQDFARAIESYSLAASDVGGLMLPVASAWLAAWKRDASLPLYAPDGLHPSVTGSYLAALVMYAKILNRTPVGLPARVALRTGGTVLIDPVVAATLQQAAAEVTVTPP
jgi:hypothetical protein